MNPSPAIIGTTAAYTLFKTVSPINKPIIITKIRVRNRAFPTTFIAMCKIRGGTFLKGSLILYFRPLIGRTFKSSCRMRSMVNEGKLLTEDEDEIVVEKPRRIKRIYDQQINDLLMRRKLYRDHDEIVKNGLFAIREDDEEGIKAASYKAKKLIPRLERREDLIRGKIKILKESELRWRQMRKLVETRGGKTPEQKKEISMLRKRMKRLTEYRQELSEIESRDSSKKYWANYVADQGNKMQMSREELMTAKKKRMKG